MTAAKSSPAAGAPLTLDVTILGREFKVACGEGERAELGEAVAYVDRKMREIRDRGRVTGADRIAVVAALNIAHDLLRERRASRAPGAQPASGAVDGEASRRRIQAMQAAIEQTLAGQEKLF